MQPTSPIVNQETHQTEPNISQPHPDQKYINALLNNDIALLDELYKKYSGKIKTMIVQNNGSECEAADIFQEALLAIYRRAKAGNFILTCPFEAFIYTVCRNKWLKELSKKKINKTADILLEDPCIAEDSFKIMEQHKIKQARIDLFKEKFGELSENSKELLRLSWSRKSMYEVAQILNVSYSYVRKRKSECMAKLAALMKQSAKFNSLRW